MSLRGRIYALGAYARGQRWRRRLRQIHATDARDIERGFLAALLRHAISHVPYYADLGLIRPDLDAFPLLSRTALRTQYERLLSDGLNLRRCRATSTGGSTGEPVRVVLDREFLAWDHATDMYAFEVFCGVPPFEFLASRRVAIWHRRRRHVERNPLMRIAGRMLNQLIFIEPYEVLTEAKLDEHIRRINAHKPAVITAFAGTAFEIAKHIQRTGVSVHRPRVVVTSVEMLYPAMRETIRSAFGCPVFNRYGAAEVGRVAAECSEGKLHVCSFNNHVEVIDDDGVPTRPGAVGRVIVTPLHNLAMPLIRYDIGDLARVSCEPCRCGSPLPAWDEICGRVVHHFVLPDGTAVFGGNFIAMFYEYDWMLQLHVLQPEIDRVEISYKRTPGRDVPKSDLDALTQTVRRVMGESCSVVWQEVDVIPHSPIGKHLHVRSLVWEEQTGIRGAQEGLFTGSPATMSKPR